MHKLRTRTWKVSGVNSASCLVLKIICHAFARFFSVANTQQTVNYLVGRFCFQVREYRWNLAHVQIMALLAIHMLSWSWLPANPAEEGNMDLFNYNEPFLISWDDIRSRWRQVICAELSVLQTSAQKDQLNLFLKYILLFLLRKREIQILYKYFCGVQSAEQLYVMCFDNLNPGKRGNDSVLRLFLKWNKPEENPGNSMSMLVFISAI